MRIFKFAKIDDLTPRPPLRFVEGETNSLRASLRWVIIACMMLVALPIAAQPPPELTPVYVTVQDFTVLRAGPGRLFERLAVLDPGTTLQATGRTIDARWIQVAYTDGHFEEGVRPELINSVTVNGVTYGWMAYWLLVWSGDILELPIDGVRTVRFAREEGPVITIQPDNRYYVYQIDPSTRAEGVITEPTRVEVTGRLGSTSSGFFWLQFKYNDQYFWTANWEVGYPAGYFSTPDRAYLYAYGRLLNQLTLEINRNGAILNNIARRWRDLDAGFAVTCNNIPPPAALRDESFDPADVADFPVYQSTVIAMQEAIVNINAALTAFEEVCNRPDDQRFVTPEDVQAALVNVEGASRSITVARHLLNPLAARNPLLGN